MSSLPTSRALCHDLETRPGALRHWRSCPKIPHELPKVAVLVRPEPESTSDSNPAMVACFTVPVESSLTSSMSLSVTADAVVVSSSYHWILSKVGCRIECPYNLRLSRRQTRSGTGRCGQSRRRGLPGLSRLTWTRFPTWKRRGSAASAAVEYEPELVVVEGYAVWNERQGKVIRGGPYPGSRVCPHRRAVKSMNQKRLLPYATSSKSKSSKVEPLITVVLLPDPSIALDT